MRNEKLLAARREKGVSQETVERALGASSGSVSKWETGKAFPEEYTITKLCKYYGKTCVELGLEKTSAQMQKEEEESLPPPVASSSSPRPEQRQSSNVESTAQNKQRIPFHFYTHYLPIFLVVFLTICTLGAVIFFAALLPHLQHTNLNQQAPIGGVWISPTKGQVVHTIVTFAAYAAPAKPTDPKIDHVNFTAWWPGVNPNHWVILCTAFSHNTQNVFSCKSNLALLAAPAGNIHISFDVYNSQGNVRYSPDNEFDIVYVPYK